MSFRDYLHEKAEESRHNETVAYLMFLAGAMFLVGGILETLSVARDARWFLLIPYSAEPSAGAVLGLTLIISGFSLIVFGIAAGVNYSRERGWYMQELRKANSLEEVMMQGKSSKTPLKKKKGNM
jgi:heme/copper-type cytochrome/quinol oxidase subunit 1